MNIILFGFQKSGKTFFGKRLAADLNRPFVDTDDLIIKMVPSKQRLTVRDIHRVVGEHQFRALESHAIQKLIPMTRTVVALGGGAVLNPDHVKLLTNLGQLVYLQASFDTIHQRMIQQGFPSFVAANDPLESLKKIYRERIAIYESIPAWRINTDIMNPQEVVSALRLYGESK